MLARAACLSIHTVRNSAKDLEQVVWKTDPSGNTLSELNNRDRMRTHLSDALGYYVLALMCWIAGHRRLCCTKIGLNARSDHYRRHSEVHSGHSKGGNHH